MNNKRRDNSPLTDEELIPYNTRVEELFSLFTNDEISIDEYQVRIEKYKNEFPWIEYEIELPRKASCVRWMDSLGNSGYFIDM